MKKIFTILAITASVLAIIFSVLPISNLTIFPAAAAVIFGFVAFYLSKKTGEVKKVIQFSFLLTMAALAIVTYKSVFTETEIASTEIIDTKEAESDSETMDDLEGLEIKVNELEINEKDLEILNEDMEIKQ